MRALREGNMLARIVANELSGGGRGYRVQAGGWACTMLRSADECVAECLKLGYGEVWVVDTANTLEKYADDPRVTVYVVA
jgi:hypothetical protein